jgi:hypothetical protein
MRRIRRPFSNPISLDLLGLAAVVTLVYFSPAGRREQLERDFVVMVSGHPAEPSADLSAPKPDPVINGAAGLGNALRAGTQGLHAIYSIPPHGYQPFMEYEKGLDREFEGSFPPQPDHR